MLAHVRRLDDGFDGHVVHGHGGLQVQAQFRAQRVLCFFIDGEVGRAGTGLGEGIAVEIGVLESRQRRDPQAVVQIEMTAAFQGDRHVVTVVTGDGSVTECTDHNLAAAVGLVDTRAKTAVHIPGIL